MKLRYSVVSIIAALFLLVGCKGMDNFSEEGAKSEKSISFGVQFSSLLSKHAVNNAAVNEVQGRLANSSNPNPGIFFGSVEIFKDDNGAWVSDSTQMVTISIDSEWQAKFYQTINVATGKYKFSLTLEKDGQYYQGEALVEVTDGSDYILNMDIRPIIGDTNGEVTLKNGEIGKFSLKYLKSEFDALDSPTLTIALKDREGNDKSATFQLNEFTEGGDYINAEFWTNMGGEYNVCFTLKEGDTTAATKCDDAEEFTTFVKGEDLEINLTPVSARTTVKLEVKGSDAKFQLVIPAIIVDEAGGLDNLTVSFNMRDPETADSIQEMVVVLDPDSQNYIGTTTYSDVKYNTKDISVSFVDKDKVETLGSCNYQVSLTNDVQDSSKCQIGLLRRARITGHLMETLVINVISFGLIAENDAIVTITPISGSDGYKVTGLTRDGLLDSAGYFKTDLIAGTYTITVSKGGKQVSHPYDVGNHEGWNADANTYSAKANRIEGGMMFVLPE